MVILKGGILDDVHREVGVMRSTTMSLEGDGGRGVEGRSG